MKVRRVFSVDNPVITEEQQVVKLLVNSLSKYNYNLQDEVINTKHASQDWLLLLCFSHEVTQFVLLSSL